MTTVYVCMSYDNNNNKINQKQNMSVYEMNKRRLESCGYTNIEKVMLYSILYYISKYILCRMFVYLFMA